MISPTRKGEEMLVPFDDSSTYTALAGESARAASAGPGSRLVILVDGETLDRVDAVKNLAEQAGRVVILADPFYKPPLRETPGRAVVVKDAPGEAVNQRVLVLFSSTVSVALQGEGLATADRDGSGFRGGWTALRPHVRSVAEELLKNCGEKPLPTFPEKEEHAALDHSAALTSRLMVFMSRHVVERERDLVLDKSDLCSVLDILKAISAKRRAHDILFVFVEQIAQVVRVDRCSVLRIWGGENKKGHVLASHEDEAVANLTIDLGKYPEVKRAMETGSTVLLNDTRRHPMTRDFASELKKAGVRSLIVVPIVLYDEDVGSLMLRAARAKGSFTPREVNFCEIVAEAAANALERAHLFESIQKANERLERLAITDGLTGLYNHRFFRRRLEEEFERARRYALPLSCLILDIDNFKRINDTYGHLLGDRVLRELAGRVVRTVRKIDAVARYGGEEIVVIMPQTGWEGSRTEAERILTAISEAPYSGLPKDEKMTASIGVAVVDHDTMLDWEALIRAADSALYEAKRKGKNQVVMGRT